MKITETGFEGLLIIEPKVFSDDRGYFFESYNSKILLENNINYSFVQDNQAKSSYGVIRGLHYQIAPYAQTKLIRVIEGEILDIVLDIRKDSATFGKTFGIKLTSQNFNQLLVPKGFAHGYSVLSEICIVQYKCDNFYHQKSEAGINIFDSGLNIDWKIPQERAIISQKDKIWPMFNQISQFF